MAYARKSGYSGNGKLPRGARIMQVNVQDDIYWTQTYIRDFEGKTHNQESKAEICQKGSGTLVEQSVCCAIYGEENHYSGDNIFYDDNGYIKDLPENNEVKIHIIPASSS